FAFEERRAREFLGQGQFGLLVERHGLFDARGGAGLGDLGVVRLALQAVGVLGGAAAVDRLEVVLVQVVVGAPAGAERPLDGVAFTGDQEVAPFHRDQLVFDADRFGDRVADGAEDVEVVAGVVDPDLQLLALGPAAGLVEQLLGGFGVVGAVFAAGAGAAAEDGGGDPAVGRGEAVGADHVDDAFAVDRHGDRPADVDVVVGLGVHRVAQHGEARVVAGDAALGQLGVVDGLLVVGRGGAADVDVAGQVVGPAVVAFEVDVPADGVDRGGVV